MYNYNPYKCFNKFSNKITSKSMGYSYLDLYLTDALGTMGNCPHHTDGVPILRVRTATTAPKGSTYGKGLPHRWGYHLEATIRRGYSLVSSNQTASTEDLWMNNSATSGTKDKHFYHTESTYGSCRTCKGSTLSEVPTVGNYGIVRHPYDRNTKWFPAPRRDTPLYDSSSIQSACSR